MEVPGRPKTMADRVTRLAQRALQLNCDVWYAAPEQYREGASARTEVALTWSSAIARVARARHALEELAQLLRKRAGMPPWKATYIRRARVPEDERE